MENDIGRALKRELGNVRLSDEAAALIALRARRARRARKFRGAAKSALAMAAAALILAGVVNLTRKNANPARVNTPLAAATAAAEDVSADMKLVYAEGSIYHTLEKCEKADKPTPCTLKSAKDKGLTECAVCKARDEGAPLSTPEPTAVNELILLDTPKPTAINEQITLYTPAPMEADEVTPIATPETMAVDEDMSVNADMTDYGTGTYGAESTLPTEQSEIFQEDFCWAEEDGTYYHSLSNCSGMLSSKSIRVYEAIKLGKQACPECEINGGRVWYTPNGVYYHSVSDCSNMNGATLGTRLDAIFEGKLFCPTCLPNEPEYIMYYWGTDNGVYYHTYETCSEMKNARPMTLEEAESTGKKPCPYCADEMEAN